MSVIKITAKKGFFVRYQAGIAAKAAKKETQSERVMSFSPLKNPKIAIAKQISPVSPVTQAPGPAPSAF